MKTLSNAEPQTCKTETEDRQRRVRAPTYNMLSHKSAQNQSRRFRDYRIQEGERLPAAGRETSPRLLAATSARNHRTAAPPLTPPLLTKKTAATSIAAELTPLHSGLAPFPLPLSLFSSTAPQKLMRVEGLVHDFRVV